MRLLRHDLQRAVGITTSIVYLSTMQKVASRLRPIREPPGP